MAEVKIIYWSGTGNTAAMAQSVADGVTAAGAEAKIIPVENAGAADKIKQKRRKNPYDFCGEDYTEERCKKSSESIESSGL